MVKNSCNKVYYLTMYSLVIFSALLLTTCNGYSIINIGKRLKEPSVDAIMARYVVGNVVWGLIVSQADRDNISAPPLSDIKAFSDGPFGAGRGKPYIFMTNYELSGQNISADPRVSIEVSMVETLELDNCTSFKITNQNPRCSRVVFSGLLKSVFQENVLFANMSLLDRHPQIANYPVCNAFDMLQLDIRNITLFDGFGDSKDISSYEYYCVTPEDIQAFTQEFKIESIKRKNYIETGYHSLYYYSVSDLIIQPTYGTKIVDMPKMLADVKMSRYIIRNCKWAIFRVLSFTSTSLPVPHIVDYSDGPHNNSTGIPYIYISVHDSLPLDDINVKKIILLTTSLDTERSCDEITTDETDPRCQSVILQGRSRKVDPNSEEHKFALEGIFNNDYYSRNHTILGNKFIVATIDIEEITLISKSGMDTSIPVDEYLSNN